MELKVMAISEYAVNEHFALIKDYIYKANNVENGFYVAGIYEVKSVLGIFTRETVFISKDDFKSYFYEFDK